MQVYFRLALVFVFGMCLLRFGYSQDKKMQKMAIKIRSEIRELEKPPGWRYNLRRNKSNLNKPLHYSKYDNHEKLLGLYQKFETFQDTPLKTEMEASFVTSAFEEDKGGLVELFLDEGLDPRLMIELEGDSMALVNFLLSQPRPQANYVMIAKLIRENQLYEQTFRGGNTFCTAWENME